MLLNSFKAFFFLIIIIIIIIIIFIIIIIVIIIIIIIIIIIFYLLLSKIMELNLTWTFWPIFFVSPGLPCLVNILEVKSSLKEVLISIRKG